MTLAEPLALRHGKIKAGVKLKSFQGDNDSNSQDLHCGCEATGAPDIRYVLQMWRPWIIEAETSEKSSGYVGGELPPAPRCQGHMPHGA